MNTKDDSLRLLKKIVTQIKLEKEDRYPSKETRLTELLKKPDRDQSDKDNWFIYVPSFFNDCLDITKTPRVVETISSSKDETTQKVKKVKKVEKVWTQGSRFAFHRGCILYDTPKAYQKWGNAVEKINYCISIYSGTIAVPAMNEKERFPGVVEFSILSPRPLTMKLEEIGEFTLTQDEFVGFLINGNPEIIPK
jgi:hypothetical protein